MTYNMTVQSAAIVTYMVGAELVILPRPDPDVLWLGPVDAITANAEVLSKIGYDVTLSRVYAWGQSNRHVVMYEVTLDSKTTFGATALQVSQKARQHAGLISERDRPCLTAPEATALGVNADLIDQFAHAGPVPGIADAEQLPVGVVPTDLSGDGFGTGIAWGQVQ